MTIRLLTGDCREVLKTLPADSVDCVVTSPPYWGLRDYGIAGQMGMESTWEGHVEAIVAVLGEVRRVLKPTGTLWLNYGDSYASSISGQKTGPDGRVRPGSATNPHTKYDDRTFTQKPFSTIQGVLKPKDLCGIPWRVAFALQADGWYLRQDIIWSKPNPMPESITDRCTKAHEYIFLLAKSRRYYFDAEAIREENTWPDHNRFGNKNAEARRVTKLTGNMAPDAPEETDRTGRNKRSVWEVATQPFSEAHFATFPPALIEPCILAGCPVGGVVLDPFGGAGTTGLVADRLGRNAILIELNPSYAAIGKRRIVDDAPLFAEVAAE